MKNEMTEQETIEKILNSYYETFGYEKDGDITLEDVLIAIKKEIEKDKISHSDGYGFIVDLCYRQQYNSWTMGKPFQEQSKAVKDFIGNLLTNAQPSNKGGEK